MFANSELLVRQGNSDFDCFVHLVVWFTRLDLSSRAVSLSVLRREPHASKDMHNVTSLFLCKFDVFSSDDVRSNGGYHTSVRGTSSMLDSGTLRSKAVDHSHYETICCVQDGDSAVGTNLLKSAPAAE